VQTVEDPKGNGKHDVGSGYAGSISNNNWIRRIRVRR
jgi:hypothetical protein